MDLSAITILLKIHLASFVITEERLTAVRDILRHIRGKAVHSKRNREKMMEQ